MKGSLKVLLVLLAITTIIKSDEASVRDCITRTSKGSVQLICPPTSDGKINIACYNGFYSMTLCLANNQCYDAKKAQTMPSQCWHCWADLQLDNDEMKKFQDTIRGCSWQLYTKIAVALIAVLSLMML